MSEKRGRKTARTATGKAAAKRAASSKAPATGTATGDLLFDRPAWSFETLARTHDAIEEVARGELGLDPYPTRLEVVSSEQMLDAYAATGMPVMYPHWSFGKRFARQEMLYRKGFQQLALEIVINSNPSLCYIMEDNTMAAQATVIAHAAIGHNHFFRHNNVFREWTEADSVLDELRHARRFVMECEERHGRPAVEKVLDAAHALLSHGVDRAGRGERPDPVATRARLAERARQQRLEAQDLWLRTVPSRAEPPEEGTAAAERRAMGLPEENLLLFLENHAPLLDAWQRELLRIVRWLATYFEPQRQTKLMNEGCATWCHFEIMQRLRDRGRIGDGAMLEFLDLHSMVVAQPSFDSQGYGGLNPYALGFAMMRDIVRVCTEPTEEDAAWFPDIAGNGRPVETLRRAWADFRDESFVRQYLSPRLIREWRLFSLCDDAAAPALRVEAIHDDEGYRRIVRALADQYDPAAQTPAIEVTGADLRGERVLHLRHSVQDGRVLDPLEVRRVLRHVQRLWGYAVHLTEADAGSGTELTAYRSDGA
ncbi:SpoVR family protein [Rhodovulum sp. 12E13]|uniref:SpoVR family protein n=1 Tax=Rhodovulum sp. 12E13 TaxID=2203891 RepID=UPI000E139CE3|nr:SpoVR family protein [Rhodovulum sp. 12E13]RDC72564.1 SpoVR family protein [Rhodovulum sp. 12E13]